MKMSYFYINRIKKIYSYRLVMLVKTSAVAQHRLRPNKLNQTHNCKNKFTFLRFIYSLSHPCHHQSSLLCLLSSLLHCTMTHTDNHMGKFPFPVTMRYSYFRFWLILHRTFEGSSHQGVLR